MLELNCLILGQDTHRIFPVKIEGAETVGTLKEMIKEKNEHALHNVDANSLRLWKVSIPVGEKLEEKVNDKGFVLHDKDELRSLELSGIFLDPPLRNHLHIIACTPSDTISTRVSADPEQLLKLNCHVVGEGVESMFVITIKSSSSVYDLKKAIQKERYDQFQGIPTAKLGLWKASIAMDENFATVIHNLSLPSDQLSALDELSKVFLDQPPPREQLHILVTGQRSCFVPQSHSHGGM
ncbi:hypothetical protein F5148DRAFT_736488 [Russula earlei]|uniref:Uncharacterized protein n=1 Tax=Russula earlei TaxID=71964 RepID=A0ACC0TU81_9AGAM|nr:hypothetical protein F5148DRAFT_736488 [Russula earlei]